MKKTRWFSARVKPVRVGLYEVNRPGVCPDYPVRTFLQWHGTRWSHTQHSSKGQFPYTNASMWHPDKWRGLAEKP